MRSNAGSDHRADIADVTSKKGTSWSKRTQRKAKRFLTTALDSETAMKFSRWTPNSRQDKAVNFTRQPRRSEEPVFVPPWANLRRVFSL